MLLVISLPGTMALCASLIASGRIFFKQFASTFDKIFVYHIVKTDWTKLGYFLGAFSFRNKANICLISPRRHNT